MMMIKLPPSWTFLKGYLTRSTDFERNPTTRSTQCSL